MAHDNTKKEKNWLLFRWLAKISPDTVFVFAILRAPGKVVCLVSIPTDLTVALLNCFVNKKKKEKE